MKILIAPIMLAVIFCSSTEVQARQIIRQNLNLNLRIHPNPVQVGSKLRVDIRTHPHADCIGGLAFPGETMITDERDGFANRRGFVSWSFRIPSGYRSAHVYGGCFWSNKESWGGKRVTIVPRKHRS